MHENRISGSIPEEFGALSSHLQQLYVAQPEPLPAVPRLTHYSSRSYLSDNLLDSTIPSELGSLASLRDLQLGDNRLEGTLPAEVLRLPKLHTLQVNENRLEGTIPADVSAASSLHNMYALVGAPCAC